MNEPNEAQMRSKILRDRVAPIQKEIREMPIAELRAEYEKLEAT